MEQEVKHRKMGRELTRRQFVRTTASATAGILIDPWMRTTRAAQMGRNHIVIMGGGRVPRFANHGPQHTELTGLVDAGLAGQNPASLDRFPWLAEELPSIKKGTWKIDYQKKTMVTVYRLRRDLRWHDGKPHTSYDFRFGWDVHRHPQFPSRDRLIPDLIEKIETPDDRTVVIHWKNLYRDAHAIQKDQLRAWPRHILEDAFKSGDMKSFSNHRYWNRQFIGVGPYRLTDWGGGNQIQFEAYPHYPLGRPKIDRITYRVMEDSNTALTAVLAGEIDFSLRDTISFDGALILKEQWEAKGLGTVSIRPVAHRWLNLSGTNPFFKDVRVRRALLHAIDREALVKNLFKGLVPVIHFPMSPFRKAFKRADAVATKYEYNPNKAKQLLADAGWKPGTDGFLVNPKGERMEIEFRTEAGDRADEEAQAIIIDFWKKVGVSTQIRNFPQRILTSEEYRNRWPGAMLGGHSVVVEEWAERYHSAGTPTEENRWSTQSATHWRNSQADAIMDELRSVISEDRTIDLQIEFIKLYTRDLPNLPLYYTPEIMIIKKGLTGFTPRVESGAQNISTWNIHQWNKV